VPTYRFVPRVFELARDLEPAAALQRLASRRLPLLLDSAAGEPRRASVLAFDPLPPRATPPSTIEGGAGFADLRALTAELERDGGDDPPGPFHGGLACALAYDLGAPGERPLDVRPEPWGLPLCVGGLYVDFLVRDEHERRTWLVLGEEPGDGRAPLAERRAEIEGLLAAPPPAAETRAGPLVRHVPPAEHRRRVERVREHIAAGDVYQANLAHRFTCSAAGPPAAWYARLRAHNPAPYMGFLAWEEHDGCGAPGALLSSSPELLLEYDGRTSRSRPIKGTAPRSDDPAEDRRLAQGLLASAKDQAELVMIVDLVRNDLGKNARPGRVWVEGCPRLASYARVHHLLGDVVCEPAAGVDAFALLAALFPGGSITGAPKLRAMEVIAELEGEGRGFYTGSLGFVDTRGHAAFNILIRTLLWRPPGELGFRVGGGITFGSDAEREERETLDKAAALLAALGRGDAAV
jgi:anthranilate/para-aminobenzoate synthase component I